MKSKLILASILLSLGLASCGPTVCDCLKGIESGREDMVEDCKALADELGEEKLEQEIEKCSENAEEE